MRFYTFLITLIAVISLVVNFKLLAERKNPGETTYKVLEVIDGDTLKINSNGEERRVRLMGVNAPELTKCLGIEAKEKLKELVINKKIILKDQFNDPYGRIMVNVLVGEMYINKEMLSSGFGRMDYYENPRRFELKEAYAEARTKKQGLFSGVCVSKIPPLGCEIKGNLDDNTQKKIYFLPSCRNYSQVVIDLSGEDSWFCLEEEAIKAGFIKSGTCE